MFNEFQEDDQPLEVRPHTHTSTLNECVYFCRARYLKSIDDFKLLKVFLVFFFKLLFQMLLLNMFAIDNEILFLFKLGLLISFFNSYSFEIISTRALINEMIRTIYSIRMQTSQQNKTKQFAFLYFVHFKYLIN